MSAPEAPMPVMSQYYLVIYVKGPVWSPEVTDFVKETQRRHLAYNAAQAEKGMYKIVGPFENPPDDSWRGMILIKAASLDDAKGLVDNDPAVQAGRLAYLMSGVWLGDTTFGD